MILHKIKLPYVISSILQFILLTPFLIQGYIGSDWDSYALIGSVQNLNIDFLYLPSRPPGFPVFEIFLSLLFFLSQLINVSFELVFILSQFFFVVCNNYLIYKLFDFYKKSSEYLYFVIVFSPIYLLSGFSVIDYHSGLFFGLLAVYYSIRNKNPILISIILSLAIGVRLTNLIFAISVFLIFIKNKTDITQKVKLILFTFFGTLIVYGIPYVNLWNRTLSKSMDKLNEMICIYNLTNTDHDLYSRFGRYILKQIDYLGVIGFLTLLFIVLINFKKIDFKNNIHYLIIFVSYQISFLRLPTEEGHLLPAFVAAMLLANTLNLDKKLIIVLLASTIISNFLYFSFYDVDIEDSATKAVFNIEIKNGLLIKDFNDRQKIGVDKEYHYLNAYESIKEVWSDGCPN